MFCKKCGAQIPENIKFCPKCGGAIGFIPQVIVTNTHVVQQPAMTRKTKKPYAPNKVITKIESVLILLLSLFVISVLIVDIATNVDVLKDVYDATNIVDYLYVAIPSLIVFLLMLITAIAGLTWNYEKTYNNPVEPLTIVSVIDIVVSLITSYSINIVSEFELDNSFKLMLSARLFRGTGNIMLVISIIILCFSIIRILKKIAYKNSKIKIL